MSLPIITVSIPEIPDRPSLETIARHYIMSLFRSPPREPEDALLMALRQAMELGKEISAAQLDDYARDWDVVASRWPEGSQEQEVDRAKAALLREHAAKLRPCP